MICSLGTDQATVFVLGLLGACILPLGLYYVLGGIGTIPARLGGLYLSLFGIGSLGLSLVFSIKSSF